MHTPRRQEIGRPRAAQFAARSVYIQDGNATRCGKKVVWGVRADLIGEARAGAGDGFRELTEPHRRELQVHCYRMLGSFQDAEDALQDTLLAAWQGLGGFIEGRAPLRTSLYRIATNPCPHAPRPARPPPAQEGDRPQDEPPAPHRRGEVVMPP